MSAGAIFALRKWAIMCLSRDEQIGNRHADRIIGSKSTYIT